MKFFTTVLFIGFIGAIFSMPTAYGQFQYISPVAGSQYNNPETNIILKNGSEIDEKSLDPSLIAIQGSISGLHSCRIVLSDDGKTVVIYPNPQFAGSDQVTVTVKNGFRKKNGEVITGTSFDFLVHPTRTAADIKSIQDALKYSKDSEFEGSGMSPENTRDACNIPGFTITSNGNEFNADVFYYNFHVSASGCFGRTIISNEGDSVFSQFDNERGICWTINHNGYLTYYSYIDSCYEMMDSTYNMVKQFFMGNGYRADEHEFLVFPDGHSFMLAYDVQPNLDMSAYNGLDTVDVIGCVLQELDASQNVIFQWRSWDHFLFTDAIQWEENMLPGHTSWDWIHANAMEIDSDGNLMLSSRHLCEITKIDLATGDIIWRLNGDNNQFTFVNDVDTVADATGTVLHFSGQHDFRRIANGHYTLFNNGNFVVPNESAAKEYKLDQVNKVATMVWRYAHPPVINNLPMYQAAMGSVQRLSNGNTFIDWGLVPASLSAVPRFTEVDSADNIVWEFNFLDTAYYFSYRAHKFDWNRCPPPVDSSFVLTYISSDSAVLTWATPNYNSGYIFQYKLSSSSNWISIPVLTNTITLDNLQQQSFYDWRVQSVCAVFDDSSNYSGVHQFNTLADITNFAYGENASFFLYPNPTSSVLTVSFGIKESMPVTLSIVNVLGEDVFRESWIASNGMNQKSFNVKDLAKGVYFVELKCNDFSIRRQAVIK